MIKRAQLLRFQIRTVNTCARLPRGEAFQLLSVVEGNLRDFAKERLFTGKENDQSIFELFIDAYEIWAHQVLWRFPNIVVESCSDDEEDGVIEQCSTGKIPPIKEAMPMSDYVEYLRKMDEMNRQKSVEIMYSVDTEQDMLVTVTPQSSQGGFSTVYHITFKYPALNGFSEHALEVLGEERIKELKECEGAKVLTPEFAQAGPYLMSLSDSRNILKFSSGTEIYRLPCQIVVNGTVNKPLTIPELLEYRYGFSSDGCSNDFDHGDTWITESWITIYRTNVATQGRDTIGPYEKFFTDLATRLRGKAHFYIEARASGELEKSLVIYGKLRNLGADVILYPQNHSFIDRKVHGKVMLFDFKSDNDLLPSGCHRGTLLVTSTGNFHKGANEKFRDTVVLNMHLGKDNENEKDDPIAEARQFFNILFGYAEMKKEDLSKYDFATPSFCWRPAALKRLIHEITQTYVSMNPKISDLSPFIYIKTNGITDPDICSDLVSAAKACVEVKVIARSCCDLPTKYRVANLEIRSICGKYLEHDRYVIAGVCDDGVIHNLRAYITSADMMPRNMVDRIEFITKLSDTNANRALMLFENIFRSTTDPSKGFFNIKLDATNTADLCRDEDDNDSDQLVRMAPEKQKQLMDAWLAAIGLRLELSPEETAD